jgi:cation diffusion facilitator family transporter
MIQAEARHKRSVMAVNLGLGANLLLATVKTGVGLFGHSSALLADGINSTSDVVYYVIVRIFMSFARRPADREHPYGHTQLESIAALIVGAFVITTAVAIFWDSVNSAFDMAVGKAARTAPAELALWVAVSTVALKIALTLITRAIGRDTKNPAVQALAKDHRNDVFSATGAGLGILLGRLGYTWADPLAGAVVSIIVFRTGLQILLDSSSNLMDTVPGRDLDTRVRELLRGVSGVMSVEEVQAHSFGPYLLINVTVGMDGAISVAEGDRIASSVEHMLAANIEFVRRVHVHYHPARSR